MPKKKSKKPARKTSSRSAPWYKTLEDDILTAVVGPLIVAVGQKGVKSRADLHRKFKDAHGAVSTEDFYGWLHSLGYDRWFEPQLVVPSHHVPALNGPHPGKLIVDLYREPNQQPVMRPDLAALGQPPKNPLVGQHADVPGQMKFAFAAEDGYGEQVMGGDTDSGGVDPEAKHDPDRVPPVSPVPLDDAVLGLPSASSSPDGNRTVMPAYSGVIAE